MWLYLAKLPERKTGWLLLCLSSTALLVCALLFQYGWNLNPCVKCIYQRTAVLGILLASLFPLIHNNQINRLVGYLIWGASSWWGWKIATEHVDIQNAINPLFATCDIVPNFPSFAPLHDWLPVFFAATGECGNIDWQFVGMSMPEWMQVIFIANVTTVILFVVFRLACSRNF
jgi:disulfide bond formation protein DsbB